MWRKLWSLCTRNVFFHVTKQFGGLRGIVYNQHRSIELLRSSDWPTKLPVSCYKWLRLQCKKWWKWNSLSNCSSCIWAICLFAQSWKGESYLAGLSADLLTVKLYALRTKKRLELVGRKIFARWFWRCGVDGRNHCSTGDTRRFCCRKNGKKPHYNSRPKHLVKLHVSWAGVNCVMSLIKLEWLILSST